LLTGARTAPFPYFMKRIVPLEGVSGILAADIPEDLIPAFRAAMALPRRHGTRAASVLPAAVILLCVFLRGNKRPSERNPATLRRPQWLWEPSFHRRKKASVSGSGARAGESPIGYELVAHACIHRESSDISKPTVTCLSAGSVFPFLSHGPDH
jgi:hypothetical protein